jgi:hypothetical protein
MLVVLVKASAARFRKALSKRDNYCGLAFSWKNSSYKRTVQRT